MTDEVPPVTEVVAQHPRSRIKEYPGEGIVVSFDAERCIHAAQCIMKLPAVFEKGRRPWIKPDEASADEIARVVELCPTGALQYRRTDGGPEETAPAETTVQIRNNGPIYVRGKVRVVDPRGNVLLEDTRVALCRCGASENKPFCDGSHTRIGFQSRVRADG